jgi:hypothetical protein
MTQPILAVFFATIAQFITGAIWYTPLFGKLWGKIHGFDKLDKKTQEKMMSQMGPIFGVQLLFTVITSVFLTMLKIMMPDISLYQTTAMIWLGFVVPAQVSGILFGGTEYKWMLPKALVMAGGSLVSLLVGAAVVTIIFR